MKLRNGGAFQPSQTTPAMATMPKALVFQLRAQGYRALTSASIRPSVPIDRAKRD